MKILLVCGKTGGHFYPALSLAEALKKQYDCQVDFLVTKGGIDHQKIKNDSYSMFSIDSLPLNRSTVFLKLIVNFFQSFQIIRKNSYQMVVGFGGLFSLSPILVGKCLGKYTVIHEPNIIWGQANRFLKRFTKLNMVSDDQLNEDNKTVVLGVPLRSCIQEKSIQKSIDSGSQKNFQILVLGGSQGSKEINRIIPEQIISLNSNFDIHVKHIQGKHKSENNLDSKKTDIVYEMISYSDNIEELMLESDLIIARSGASTLAEIAICAKPSILIPFPYAKDNHQVKNAQVWAQHGAAIMMEEKDLHIEFSKVLSELISDSQKLKNMAYCAKKMSNLDVSNRFADLLIGSYKNDQKGFI